MYPGAKIVLASAASVLFLLASSACTTFVSFDDISQEEKYSEIVDGEYVTKNTFLIHGVNMDRVIGPAIHQYTITPPPGIGGREIISQDELESGTRFRVTKVLLCANCYLDFSPRIKFQLELISSSWDSKNPIYLGSTFGDHKLTVSKDGAVIMNPKYFQRMAPNNAPNPDAQ